MEACTDVDWMWDGDEGDCDLLGRMELELIGLQCMYAYNVALRLVGASGDGV